MQTRYLRLIGCLEQIFGLNPGAGHGYSLTGFLVQGCAPISCLKEEVTKLSLMYSFLQVQQLTFSHGKCLHKYPFFVMYKILANTCFDSFGLNLPNCTESD